jgi:hypothetical protein
VLGLLPHQPSGPFFHLHPIPTTTVTSGHTPAQVCDVYAAPHLQTDQHLGPFLGLYQIHSATLESGVLGAADVLAALAQLKAEKGWAIGLSVSGELSQQHNKTTQYTTIHIRG